MYRLDPVTGSVRVVADGFVRCNGIAFSPHGSIAFVYVFLVLAKTCKFIEVVKKLDIIALTLGSTEASSDSTRLHQPQCQRECGGHAPEQRADPCVTVTRMTSILKQAHLRTAGCSHTWTLALLMASNSMQPATSTPDAGTEHRRVTHHKHELELRADLKCLVHSQVWNSEGTLLGKFFLGTVSANMIFAGDGRLVILADTAIFFANIAAKFNRVSFP